MITLSLNFDNLLGSAGHPAHEKKVRQLIDTHLAFPGSDKLKFDVNIKDNGSSSVSFTGPKDALAEAKRLWAENVQPAADKLKKAAERAAKDAAQRAKAATAEANKAVKKAAKKAKPAKAKVVKRPLARAKAAVKAKAKVAKKTVKKKR